MQVRLIEGKTKTSHTLEVSDEDGIRARIYFSYETVIGLSNWLGTTIRRENVWGNTTGKHMTQLGIKGFPVVSGEEFAKKLGEVFR